MSENTTLESYVMQEIAAVGQEMWRCKGSLEVGIYAAQDPDALESLRILLIQQCSLLKALYDCLGELHEYVRLRDPATQNQLDQLFDRSPDIEG